MATTIPNSEAEQIVGIFNVGNVWVAVHTADPGKTGASEATGLARQAVAENEVQTVTITGTPTGGTFTLTYSAQETAAIAYNATAADVQAALEALSNIDDGDVLCAGGPFPGTPVTVEFTGNLANTNVALMTADSTGLTGGTTPDVTVAETVAGYENWSAFADDATSGGRITDNAALLDFGTATVAETATHLGLWTAETAGTFRGGGDLTTSKAYAVDEPVTIPIGQLDLVGAGVA